jgi:hypothetical protein
MIQNGKTIFIVESGYNGNQMRGQEKGGYHQGNPIRIFSFKFIPDGINAEPASCFNIEIGGHLAGIEMIKECGGQIDVIPRTVGPDLALLIEPSGIFMEQPGQCQAQAKQEIEKGTFKFNHIGRYGLFRVLLSG